MNNKKLISQNVYYSRYYDKLYYTIPKSYLLEGEKPNKNSDACVIICLYYDDSLKIYQEYIQNAINTSDVYIITSNNRLYTKAMEIFSEFSDVHVRFKKNRGRDISALLVTSRDLFDKYQYVCFVHDKKEKYSAWKNNVATWVRSLWECTIGSEKYINNIMTLFKTHCDIGLMIPPEIIDLRSKSWYMNCWCEDFEHTAQLAHQLELNSNLDEKVPPISLGTCFWCRSVSLKKLWKKDWTYESFNEEPLPNDGTISHAIERIFPYVAQDAGYKTVTVMTEEETARILSYAQLGMNAFYKILSQELGVENINDALRYQERVSKLQNYKEGHQEIYIYGNGEVSDRYTKLTKYLNIPIAGHIVSDKGDIQCTDIYSLSEICDHIINANCGIIIGVGRVYINEVIDNLRKYHIYDYLVLE